MRACERPQGHQGRAPGLRNFVRAQCSRRQESLPETAIGPRTPAGPSLFLGAPSRPPASCAEQGGVDGHLSPRDGPASWRIPRSTDRLPGMAYVIDRVDLLGYLASDARVRGLSSGTLVVRLSEAAAYYLRETLPEGTGQPLTLACWEPGCYLVVRGGVSTQSRLGPEPRSMPRAGCDGAFSKPRDIFSATPRSSAGLPTFWFSGHRMGAARSQRCAGNSNAKATGAAGPADRRPARSRNSLGRSPLSALNRYPQFDHLKDGDALAGGVRLLAVGRNAVGPSTSAPGIFYRNFRQHLDRASKAWCGAHGVATGDRRGLPNPASPPATNPSDRRDTRHSHDPRCPLRLSR